MVLASNKGKYSSMNCIAIAEREHPLKKLIDRLNIPPYLFLSREDDDDVRDIRKHDFRSVLLHPCYLMLIYLQSVVEWNSEKVSPVLKVPDLNREHSHVNPACIPLDPAFNTKAKNCTK